MHFFRSFFILIAAGLALAACSYADDLFGKPGPSAVSTPVAAGDTSKLDAEQRAGAVARHQQETDQAHQQIEHDVANYSGLKSALDALMQAGGKPGDPRVVTQRAQAQAALNVVSSDVTRLASIAADVAGDQVRAGTSADDKRKLDQLLTQLSDEIASRSTFVRNENASLLAIARGGTAASEARRPLVVIRFDRPDVPYQQALSGAVKSALERRPGTRFDLVAVAPRASAPAQMAQNADAAKRNMASVLRSLAGMGVRPEQLSLSSTTSGDASSNEVRVYLR